MRRTKPIAIGILCVSSLILAAKDAPGSPVTIAVSDVVHNKRTPTPPPGTPADFRIGEDLVLGPNDTSGEPLFVQARAVTVDDDGNIYVLDSKACNIIVFDKLGRLIRRIGRMGQGPGEMIAPARLSMLGNDAFMVYDVAVSRITSFSLGGEFRKQWNTADARGMLLRVMPCAQGGFYGLVSVPGEEFRDRLIHFDADFKAGPVIGETGALRGGGTEIPFFKPQLCFDRIDGGILWGVSDAYELTVSSPEGAVIRRFTKDARPLKITEKDKTEEIFARFGKDGLPPEYKALFPEYLPAFRFLIADDSGRLYVRTYEKDPAGRDFYDVFNSDGIYIAMIALPGPPAAIKNGMMYTIEETADGFQVIKRYACDWK